MDRLYRDDLNQKHGFHELLYALCRLSMCLYGLVYFLNTVINVPYTMIPVFRYATVIFSFLGAVFSGDINLRRIRFSRFFVWYFGVLVLSVVTGFYSPNDSSSYTENIFNILLIGSIFSYSVKKEYQIKRFLFEFAICGIIVFYVLFSKNLLYMDDRLGRTLTSGNLNSFALFLMLSLTSSLFLFIISEKKIIRILSLVFCVPIVYMMLLSGGRKYVITPIIIVLCYNLLQTQDKNRAFKKLFIFIVVFVVVAYGWNLIMTNDILYRSIGRRFVEAQGVENRLDMIWNGLKMFLQSPIWGHGENAYVTLLPQYMNISLYSHNNYIELLVNQGLIGFSWYYYFYLNSTKKLFVYARENVDKMARCFASFMIGSLFMAMGTVSYCSSSLIFVFYVISFNIVERNNADNRPVVGGYYENGMRNQ